MKRCEGATTFSSQGGMWETILGRSPHKGRSVERFSPPHASRLVTSLLRTKRMVDKAVRKYVVSAPII